MLNSLLPSDTCQAPRWWRSTSKSPRHEHDFLWSNASPPRSEVSIHFQRRAFLRTITPTCPLHQLNCPKVKCKSPCKLPINPMVSRAQCLLQHGWCSSKQASSLHLPTVGYVKKSPSAIGLQCSKEECHTGIHTRSSNSRENHLQCASPSWIPKDQPYTPCPISHEALPNMV